VVDGRNEIAVHGFMAPVLHEPFITSVLHGLSFEPCMDNTE
jgi:hypothetical protein